MVNHWNIALQKKEPGDAQRISKKPTVHLGATNRIKRATVVTKACSRCETKRVTERQFETVHARKRLETIELNHRFQIKID